MLSTIKIDFDEQMQPVIVVKIHKGTEDPRDKLLQVFFEKLGHQSILLTVENQDVSDTGKAVMVARDERSVRVLRPVEPKNLREVIRKAAENCPE